MIILESPEFKRRLIKEQYKVLHELCEGDPNKMVELSGNQLKTIKDQCRIYNLPLKGIKYLGERKRISSEVDDKYYRLFGEPVTFLSLREFRRTNS